MQQSQNKTLKNSHNPHFYLFFSLLLSGAGQERPFTLPLSMKIRPSFEARKIASLHRWDFSLVNGVFRKLRTECPEPRHYHA